jgi:outer membrane protein
VKAALRAIAAVAFLAGGSAGAQTQDVMRLTLDECLARGLARSIPLANARRQERIADARVRQAWSQIKPALEATANYTRLDEEPRFGGFPEPVGRIDNYSAALRAEQLIYRGGAVRAAVRAARAYRGSAALEVERAAAALRRDIRKQFYRVLYLREMRDTARQSVEQLEALADEAGLKYESETLSEFDRLSAEVRLANERPRLVQARNAMALAQTALANLIYEDAPFAVDGELAYRPLPGADLDELTENALTARWEIEQARRTIAIREADRRATAGTYYPELRAFAAYEGTNPGEIEPTEDSWEWGWSAGATLTWDLLDGGLRGAELMEKRMEEEIARARFEDVRRAIRQEVKDALLTLRDAEEAVLSTRDNVGLAERAMEIARVRYRRGLSTYLEFSDSNLALRQARLNHAEALWSWMDARADLAYAAATESDRLEADIEGDNP